MINLSSQAKVKLETLKPQVAKSLHKRLEQLGHSWRNLEALGKIKQIPGLENTYSFRVSPQRQVVFELSGENILVADIVNLSGARALIGNTRKIRSVSTPKRTKPAKKESAA